MTRLGMLAFGTLTVFLVQDVCQAQNGTGLVNLDILTGKLTHPPELPSMPLTVRPRAMRLGTETAKAGNLYSDAALDYVVHVPPQCVGKRQCPLILFLHGINWTPQQVLDAWSAPADKYGMIVLAPHPHHDWQLDDEQRDHDRVDSALKEVLSRFAIDPNRIALIGNSASGGASMAFGGTRLDLFSRVVLASTNFSIANVDPQNKTSRFLVTFGCLEGGAMTEVRALRHDGHPVDVVVGFRGHMLEAEDWDIIGHWLYESWVTPDAVKARPSTVASSTMPILTTNIIKKMTTFWSKFTHEPDSMIQRARVAHLREVVVPLGSEKLSVFMTDMPALAAQFPTVAADLRAAGLTPKEHDSYRVALLSRMLATQAVRPPRSHLDSLQFRWNPLMSLDTTSAQGRNLMFESQNAFEALRKTGMWEMP